ncbi:MAG: hypothetical protein EXS59_02320 [Candidatus Taylorbacteria bacterium]|nr:hypothetical protein [Candidatus Taylorbacteria bacterium]
MAVIMKNPITGTRGVLVSDLPEDWNEAEMELKERTCDREDNYSPQFVAAVWVWGSKELGKDARNMSVVELAAYWYEFA